MAILVITSFINKIRDITGMTQNTTIDVSSIETLKGLMKDRFNFLIETFLTNGAQQLSDLRTAISNNSNDDIIALTHALKGSCGSVGALSMHELARVYEDKSRNNNFDDVDQWADSLESELERYKNDIQAYL